MKIKIKDYTNIDVCENSVPIKDLQAKEIEIKLYTTRTNAQPPIIGKGILYDIEEDYVHIDITITFNYMKNIISKGIGGFMFSKNFKDDSIIYYTVNPLDSLEFEVTEV